VRNTLGIDSSYFRVVVDAMEQVVGPGGTANRAKLKDIVICGKTGTVQNEPREDHSVFVCFAPKNNPKIALSVYVENAGFGGTWAAPIASLMIEKYLKDSVATNRKALEEKMYNAKVIPKYTYIIDSATRLRDKMIWERKQFRKKYDDSMKHHRDSMHIRHWIKKNLM
jgi:penicillin-binding protein 2